jgi:acyl-CoA hydrolase
MVFLTDEAKHIIEGDHEPASELPASPPSDVDHAVARLIADDIDDDSCIQIGIGGMPNALCSLLLESGGRNMGVAAAATKRCLLLVGAPINGGSEGRRVQLPHTHCGA